MSTNCKPENYAHLAMINEFFIDRSSGETRLYHARDKISPRSKYVVRAKGDLADTFINKRGYRIARTSHSGKSLRLSAHGVIWVLANGRDLVPGMVIDHLNRNKLDNDPQNLILRTQRDNVINTSTCDKKLIGVRPISSGRWAAVATSPITKKECWLGAYSDKLDAARAYDAFVVHFYGSSSQTNLTLGRLGVA